VSALGDRCKSRTGGGWHIAPLPQLTAILLWK
jgi:hypothetical protein